MPTQQDYGQWQYEGTGPGPGHRYRTNWWFKRPQDSQVHHWDVFWSPSEPEWCVYWRPAQAQYPGAWMWRCMTPFHPNYPNGGQSWCKMQNNDHFGPPGDPPDIPDTNDNPDDPPDPPGSCQSTTTTPAGAADSPFQVQGLVFKVFLTHQQVQALAQAGSLAASIVPNPAIRAAIVAAASYVQIVDNLGGQQGVDISGVIGTTTIIVTPHNSIDIFRVVNVAAGIANQIADQASQAAAQGVKVVVDGIHQAEDAGKKAVNGFHDFIHGFGLS
jgi:hypothetical protein